MTDRPQPRVEFTGGCPDPGRRRVELPRPLPEVGDDFDWNTRDFDGFRRFMLEALAAHQPGRRWSAADFEVVLVETLAVVLDQLSDMADRVAAETWLETARRPESVWRLLSFIGAVDDAGEIDRWRADPRLMEAARRDGPRSIHRLERMVTLDDHRVILERHPLVQHASAWSEWNGAWEEIKVGLILIDPDGGGEARGTAKLEDAVAGDALGAAQALHEARGWPYPIAGQTYRAVLQRWVDAHRMIARQVTLVEAREVGLILGLRVHLRPSYFRSEVHHAIERTLGPDGFFRPGRLSFGDDVHVSQLTSLVQRLPGVLRAEVTALRRVGEPHDPARVPTDLRLDGLEFARCANDPRRPEHGWWHIDLCGGRPG